MGLFSLGFFCFGVFYGFCLGFVCGFFYSCISCSSITAALDQESLEDFILVKETGFPLLATNSCFFHIWQQGGKQEVCYIRTVT